MKTKFVIKTKKKRIPRALREQIWIKHNKGKVKKILSRKKLSKNYWDSFF